MKTDRFYYLCNDFAVSTDSGIIKRASKYIEPLDSSFFSINERDSKVTINLQAIVGKNGDGKSTLVEIALRLINNFALYNNIGNSQNLTKANGVCAELYYQYNDTFYCLRENGAISLHDYRYDESRQLWAYNSEVSNDALAEGFFYTLVSNYSHYAYNTLQYAEESTGQEYEECWLHNIFHKNDAYQVPLSLHPFRSKGNIDINRESELTKPRLVSTFVRSLIAADNRQDTYTFNGKQLVGLRLKDVGYSKFLIRTLYGYFETNRYTNLLKDEIESLREIDVKKCSDKDKTVLTRYTKELDETYHRYFSYPTNRQFYKLIRQLEHIQKLQDPHNDVSIFLNLLEEKSSILEQPEADKLKEICSQWREYAFFNLSQIQWIDFIDDICDQWRNPGVITGKNQSIRLTEVTPELLLKPYEDLNDREKCLHYIIYNTISIFQTYESYGKPCHDCNRRPYIIGGNPKPRMPYDKWENVNISKPFAKLSQDWLFGSHITLKLRQTYNFYKQEQDSTYNLYSPKAVGQDASQGILLFSNYSEQDKCRLAIKEQLPPAIYYWDLVFRADNEYVGLESFSSGEKQRLFGISAIIYHLQNIDSISTEKFHYHSVNVILEEIEFYFHPEWQRTFCYDLMNMIRDAGFHQINAVNVLFVTHSPYILSDIPKTHVLFLKDGDPERSMQENTFGANINSLLKNGFFMPGLPMGGFCACQDQ
ncbi:hypothetical protein JQM83_14015 [Parabacteroides distasonis]|nr:hypothetical protein [Parabacteroides distasonis]